MKETPLHLGVVALVAALSVAFTACGGKDDDDDAGAGGAGGSGGSAGTGGSSAGSGGGSVSANPAAHICSEEIACGYQLVDQATCEQLLPQFFSAAQLAACDMCVTAEACATEQATCMGACSL